MRKFMNNVSAVELLHEEKERVISNAMLMLHTR